MALILTAVWGLDKAGSPHLRSCNRAELAQNLHTSFVAHLTCHRGQTRRGVVRAVPLKSPEKCGVSAPRTTESVSAAGWHNQRRKNQY
ncbi:MAG TPA: hypothetical protein VKP30_23140 [Polyangiaceae bacterium]|nr:hypothetical protein [Polyangiaceae bacterium]